MSEKRHRLVSFFFAKHINNWSPNGDFAQNYFKYLIFEKKIQKTK